VGIAVADLEARASRGEEPHDALNSAAVLMIKAAQAHARAFMMERYVVAVTQGGFSAPVTAILSQLCELFQIYWLLERSGDFVLNANLTREHILQLQSKYTSLLSAIRPHAVNLVDAFDFPDEVLNSTLGVWDGNVYQRLFDEAAKSPLNQDMVHRHSFHSYLKPLMKSNL